MNIEKVKNYNQKMLAIFFTLLAGIAAIGLISFVIFLIAEIIPNNNTNTNALLSDKKLDQLKKESLRQQIISYNTPELVDTTSLIYIIPVNVKTLSKPEEIDQQGLAMLDISKEFSSGSSDFYPKRAYFDSFNNILLYDYKKSQTQMILNKRLIGVDLQYKYFDDEIILIFTGSDNDTDLDNQITLYDFQDLYVYSLRDRVIKQIKQPNSTVDSYKFVTGGKDILITFSYDRDKDNKFDSDTEPTIVMKYDYKTGELLNVVDKSIENGLQALIDNN